METSRRGSSGLSKNADAPAASALPGRRVAEVMKIGLQRVPVPGATKLTSVFDFGVRSCR